MVELYSRADSGVGKGEVHVAVVAAGVTQNFSATFAGDDAIISGVTVDSSNVILESNETNNAAESTVTRITTGTITGTAFFDQNGNNIRDGGEQAVTDTTVTLWDSGGTNPIASRITDANGRYTFPNLSAGTYYVKWVESNCQGTPEPKRANVNLNAGATQIKDIPLPHCIF
jgi:hypothetical protein